MFIGKTRYIDFRLANEEGVAITGAVLDDFDVVFRRNNQPCSDALTLTAHGEGRYTASYEPSGIGHDYVELYHQDSDTRILDVEEIADNATLFGAPESVQVDHNYGGTDNLRVLETNPDQYQLLIFQTSEWEQGHRDENFASATTTLTSDGRWTVPVMLPAGLYHLVLTGFRFTKILRSRLDVK